jgi:YVTN family beta-propeller protein
MTLKHLFVVGALALSLWSCAGASLFTDITSTQLASPIFVAVDATNSRAYVVNSNNRLEFLDTHLTILDITNPAAPIALASATNTIGMPNFSGQAYLDVDTRRLFVSNRLSDNRDDKVDTLLRIDVNETAGTFGQVESFNTGEDPFGLTCCDASNRLYVVNEGILGAYDVSDPSTFVSISLDVTLGGDRFRGLSSREVVILGEQAFVTNRAGVIYVINLNEVGDTSKNPIDYLITGGGSLRGIVTDGILLYVVDFASSDPLLRILDPASLTAIDPDTTDVIEATIASVQVTAVAVGGDANEAALVGEQVFVTNTADDTVTVVNTGTQTVEATITLNTGSFTADEPFGVTAFTLGDNNYVYVSNLKSSNISVIDVASLAVVANYP